MSQNIPNMPQFELKSGKNICYMMAKNICYMMGHCTSGLSWHWCPRCACCSPTLDSGVEPSCCLQTYYLHRAKKEINEPSFLLLILASIAACISQRLILTLLWFCAVWGNTRIAWPGVGWGMFYTAVKTTKSTFQTGRVVEILLSNTNHQTILQFFQYINF